MLVGRTGYLFLAVNERWPVLLELLLHRLLMLLTHLIITVLDLDSERVLVPRYYLWSWSPSLLNNGYC